VTAGPEADPGIDALLSECIGSFDELQLLLLVSGARERRFTLDELAAGVGVGVETAAEAVGCLVAVGLVERCEGAPPAWRYAPRDPERAAAVDRLEAAYRENPAGIIRTLSTRSIDRVRTAALRTFADAFVLGRKDDG
jgi:hypothetical protein